MLGDDAVGVVERHPPTAEGAELRAQRLVGILERADQGSVSHGAQATGAPGQRDINGSAVSTEARHERTGQQGHPGPRGTDRTRQYDAAARGADRIAAWRRGRVERG